MYLSWPPWDVCDKEEYRGFLSSKSSRFLKSEEGEGKGKGKGKGKGEEGEEEEERGSHPRHSISSLIPGAQAVIRLALRRRVSRW